MNYYEISEPFLCVSKKGSFLFARLDVQFAGLIRMNVQFEFSGAWMLGGHFVCDMVF